jgi:hypothetical protein
VTTKRECLEVKAKDRGPRVDERREAVMAGSLSISALVLLAGLSPGAPLPLPKETPPTHTGLLGTWKAEWDGGKYLITFGPRGVYGARTPGCDGVCYTGSWWVARDVLWVRESAAWPVEGTYLYAFTGVVTRDLGRGSVGGRLAGRRVPELVDDPPPYDVELVLLERKGAR